MPPFLILKKPDLAACGEAGRLLPVVLEDAMPITRFIISLVLLVMGIPVHADPAPIRIGVIGPVSGKASEDMGLSIMGGARVFLADVNQIGGILGRRVELVERDDRSQPERGVELAKELIEKEHVVAVVGFGNSGVVLAAAKVFQQARVPLIVTAATGAAITKNYMPPEVPDSYIFRVAASDAIQPAVLLSDLIDKRRIDHIALIHDDSPYGQYGKQNVVAELARRHMELVDDESYKVGDADLGAQLHHIRDSGAQAVFMYCLAGDAATMLKAAEHMSLKLPFVGSWALSQQSFIDRAGNGADGTRTSVTFIENEASNTALQFSQAYRKINQTERIPSAVTAAQTYDALRLLALALYQSNSQSGPDIRHALEHLDQRTASTVITRYFKPFSPSDHEAISGNMLIMGEIRNGKVVYVYKDDENRAAIARTKVVAK